MKYGNVWITYVSDLKEYKGGCFCEVYADEDFNERLDDFCISPEECDCTNEIEIEKFIKEYSKKYN